MTKYDYGALEQEFISSREQISVRELGRKHGIADSKISSLHLQARKPDASGLTWYDKREQFQSRSTDQTMTLLAAREAKRRLRESVVIDHAVDLIDSALISAKESIEAKVEILHSDGSKTTERKYRVMPRDVTALIDRLALVFGRAASAQPTPGDALSGNSVTASITANAESDLGLALLGRIAGISRSQSGPTQPRTVGGTTLPDAPSTSQN